MEYTEKQTHILEAAEMLFAEKGFAGTSVRDIAQEAKVNLAMISYYFGSKEKLMEAVFEYRTHNIKLELQNTLTNDQLTPIQKVNHLIDTYLEKIMNQQCFHKIMTREQMAKDSNVRSLIEETKRKNQELVKKVIQEGQKKGDFKKNIDIPLMMMTMIGTSNQLLTTKHSYKEMNNLQDLSEEEFNKYLKKKLANHIKTLFKAILTYEA